MSSLVTLTLWANRNHLEISEYHLLFILKRALIVLRLPLCPLPDRVLTGYLPWQTVNPPFYSINNSS